MRQISAGSTFFYKRIFPVVWFGGMGVFVAIGFLTWRSAKPVEAVFFVIPLVMLALGYFLIRALIVDLADKVLDMGNALIVQKGGEEVRIPLTDIINIDSTQMMNPPRVTLTLRTGGKFGRKIVFSPIRTRRLNPLATNPLIDELVQRIDRARQAQAGERH